MASSGSPPKPVLAEAPGSHSTQQLDGSGLTIGIISTRWYEKEVVQPLVQACRDELVAKGVASDRIKCVQVPGAFEIPFAASRMIHAKKKHLDAVICIGCMVKGATMAYEFVSEAATMGLMKLNVKTDTPVVCGLLTCRSLDEAEQCAASMGACVTGEAGGDSSTKKCSHGVTWAQEAIELGLLKRATAQLIEKMCECMCHCKEQHCKCACHCKQCKCRTCTCKEGSCKCSSCFSHHDKPEHTTDEMMQQFKQAMQVGGCTACGQSGAACKCEDCSCSSCAKKSSGGAAKGSTTSCGGCTKPGCAECAGQASASGYHGRSSAPLMG